MNGFSKALQQQLKHDTPYAWFLRHQAIRSPIFRKQHIAELDDRLEAYLDCYLISEKAEQSLLPDLNFDDWGSVFVTALIALRAGNAEALAVAVDAVSTELQGVELSNAFCWEGFETVRPFLEPLVHHDNPLVREAVIVAGGYFTGSLNTAILRKSLMDVAPNIVIASLKIIGDNKLPDYNDLIEQHLTHDNEAVRFQAAYTASILSLPKASTALQHFCFTETPHLRKALGLLYQVIEASQIKGALTKIQKAPLSPRIKAYNIAMAGLPDRIPVLLEWMKDPEYAPLAGEAFSFITGADIEEDDLSILQVELCESQEAPLAEKRKQDPWTAAYEDDLPWPDPELVEQWWDTHQSRFQTGMRYLAGLTLDNANLETVRESGTQPQRHLANLMLAVREPQPSARLHSGLGV